ncbi:DEAD/DEAH box helicase [Streptomyces sp. NPDC057094]|uniref:DEAD/DEAH box helicase n=1 Tax=Streptomyces sp. NPDC057094 TaxID=3346018 RepID=UPI00363A1021
MADLTTPPDHQPRRGTNHTVMRDAVCKDCQRDPALADDAAFTYSELSGQAKVERGDSRSDRCPSCRRKHRKALQGLAVGFMDLRAIGAVTDRIHPTGPLGGLGPLPDAHTLTSYTTDLDEHPFGMTDAHILEALAKLSGDKRVLVLKAGTGTGKSTFGPFRLAFPPESAPLSLTEHGPIIVTEPRVQATTGVATFVGTKLAGTGVGPGHLVGYQVAGDKNHDDGCQIVYATDGTVVNWLKEGRLSKIGAVIVDEAHERNTNIDLILGILRRDLHRYPHLRVIITSATFDVDFYRHYFGTENTNWMEVKAVKSFGYGAPLFPGESIDDLPHWLATWWPERHAPAGPPLQDLPPSGAPPTREDLWATTRILNTLRSPRLLADANTWRTDMPALLAEQVIRLAEGLDTHDIPGDILAFLPTRRSVEAALALVTKQISPDRADIYDLLRTTPTSRIQQALAPRPPGAKRKIVIASNLAETSLTVEGVRFVVDSGLIAQSEWDPATATGGVPTKPHSQAGIRQRWGRVGRDRPGWVFPLYSRTQFEALPRDTPPGSTRENQEKLIMKAKVAGIDDAADFGWPAAFKCSLVDYDENALKYIDNFTQEMTRANRALHSSGALDHEGHLTLFGHELERFPGPAEEAVAIMLADQLACVPEIVVALALLNTKPLAGAGGVFRGRRSWPGEWRVEAASRQHGLAFACQDDLDLALSLHAAWEAADPTTRADQPSDLRMQWADTWWVDNDRLLAAAAKRQEVLETLSPAMKQEVTRPIDLRLLQRARAVICRAFMGLQYHQHDETYRPVTDPDPRPHVLDSTTLTRPGPQVIALSRLAPGAGSTVYLRNVVNVLDWAVDDAPDAFTLLQRAAVHASPRTASPRLHAANQLRSVWPVGARFDILLDKSGSRIAEAKCYTPPISYTEPVLVPDPSHEEDAEPAALTSPAEEEETAWPTGNPDPQPDEDDEQRRAVLDPRQFETNDEPALSASSATADAPGHQGQCPGVADTVTSPSVRSEERPDIPDRRYLITGYGIEDEDITVIVDRDWLEPDAPVVLGNEDLPPGSEVELVVRQFVDRSADPYRVLERADGRGRFIAYEASRSTPTREKLRQLAVALAPSDAGLLASLAEGATITGTVLPTRTAANRVSLLPYLHRHLNTARIEHHAPRNNPSGRKVWFWPATVVAAPNDHGWATVELESRDRERGIRHQFGVRAQMFQDAGLEPEVGARALVRLGQGGPDTRPLSLTEEQHQALADLLGIFAREVGCGPQSQDGEPQTGLRLWSKRPEVPARLVGTLLDQATTHQQRHDICEFAVSAHFRKVTEVLAPGDETVSHAPRHHTLADLQTQMPLGTRVRAEVTSVNDVNGRAWLTLQGGAEGTITATDFGHPTGVLQIGAWLRPGETVEAHVIGHTQRQSGPQVQLRVTGQVPDLLTQAGDLGVRVGAIIEGQICGIKDGTGLFVRITPRHQGLVHLTKLPHALTHYSHGAPLRVRVDRLVLHPQKGIEVGLSLA